MQSSLSLAFCPFCPRMRSLDPLTVAPPIFQGFKSVSIRRSRPFSECMQSQSSFAFSPSQYHRRQQTRPRRAPGRRCGPTDARSYTDYVQQTRALDPQPVHVQATRRTSRRQSTYEPIFPRPIHHEERTHARTPTHARRRARARAPATEPFHSIVLQFCFSSLRVFLRRFSRVSRILSRNRRFTAISSSRHHLGGTNAVQPRPPRRTTLTSAPPPPPAKPFGSNRRSRGSAIYWSNTPRSFGLCSRSTQTP